MVRAHNIHNAFIFCNRKKDVDILYESLGRRLQRDRAAWRHAAVQAQRHARQVQSERGRVAGVLRRRRAWAGYLRRRPRDQFRRARSMRKIHPPPIAHTHRKAGHAITAIVFFFFSVCCSAQHILPTPDGAPETGKFGGGLFKVTQAGAITQVPARREARGLQGRRQAQEPQAVGRRGGIVPDPRPARHRDHSWLQHLAGAGLLRGNADARHARTGLGGRPFQTQHAAAEGWEDVPRPAEALGPAVAGWPAFWLGR